MNWRVTSRGPGEANMADNKITDPPATFSYYIRLTLKWSDSLKQLDSLLNQKSIKSPLCYTQWIVLVHSPLDHHIAIN